MSWFSCVADARLNSATVLCAVPQFLLGIHEDISSALLKAGNIVVISFDAFYVPPRMKVLLLHRECRC